MPSDNRLSVTMPVYTSSSFSTSTPLHRSSSYTSSVARSDSRSGLQRIGSTSQSIGVRRSASTASAHGGYHQSYLAQRVASYTPPVQSSTPIYMDKFPYIRYSTQPYRPSLDIVPERASVQYPTRTSAAFTSGFSSYGNSLSTYNPRRRETTSAIDRYTFAPSRPLNVEDAVDMYK